jgi:hypothetical protein
VASKSGAHALDPAGEILTFLEREMATRVDACKADGADGVDSARGWIGPA